MNRRLSFVKMFLLLGYNNIEWLIYPLVLSAVFVFYNGQSFGTRPTLSL